MDDDSDGTRRSEQFSNEIYKPRDAFDNNRGDSHWTRDDKFGPIYVSRSLSAVSF